MNKEKYLKEIEKRLEYLTPEQKQAEIFRLSNELDTNDAINDISNEVEEIYKKYNIDVEKEKKKVEKNKAQEEKIKNMNGNMKYAYTFIESFKNGSTKEKFNIIKDFIIILLIIIAIKIPFITVETVLFSIFNNSISDGIYTVIHYVLNILYIIAAILLFIRIFKRRFKKELGLD